VPAAASGPHAPQRLAEPLFPPRNPSSYHRSLSVPAVKRPDANRSDGTPHPERAILGAVDSLVELLDRQVDFLLHQTDPAAFLVQVEPFLTALRTEPRLAAYLDDVLEEVVHIVDAMEKVDAELTAELLELRRELVELWPEADDSNVQRPSQSEPPAAKLRARLSYTGTLAYFDERARSALGGAHAQRAGG
jgi:hypothetical protein